MLVSEMKGEMLWNQRFQSAINRYRKCEGVCPELFDALTEELSSWAQILPQSYVKNGRHEPVNSWGLGTETTEIYSIVDELILQDKQHLADCLQKKFESLKDSAKALDGVCPKLSKDDHEAERRLTEHCQRQAEHLCGYLRRLKKITFASSAPNRSAEANACRKLDIKPAPHVHRSENASFEVESGTKWSDITIRFVDGHTVSIKVGHKSKIVNYTQMLMVNRHTGAPNKQWQTLRQFAENNGSLSWQSSAASLRLKKQKQQLSEKLRKFFKIAGEPIVWGKAEKCYQCQFGIE